MTPILPVCRPAKGCITLNENESKIFSLLRECCAVCKLDVTLRVAGGWVRDKLLGLECHDFDIAIDSMMGRQFAERLRQFLQLREIPSSAYGVIQANPERSKHLETATLTIFGYPIDFVNLRSESYTGHSRIPAVKFGTPREDALRRDITINALFYNLQSEMIEDYCGTAFADLEGRLVRTPLAPKETLLDDPLRLLRVVRFATRFQFRMDPELEKSIQDDQVDLAFRTKISRERVGAELDKILHCKHAFEGLCMVHRLGIFNLVFDIPPDLQDKYPAEQHLPSLDTTRHILALFDRLSPSMSRIHGYNKRLALLSAALLPHVGVMVERGGGGGGGGKRVSKEPLVVAIIRDSLKFTNQDMADVVQLFDCIPRILNLISDPSQNASPPNNRSTMAPMVVGRLIKDLGRHWEVGFYLAAIYAIVTGVLPDTEGTVRSFVAATAQVHVMGLGEAWSWRSLLSGRDLQALLGIKEGQQIGKIIAALLDWQYSHPQGDKQEAVEFVRQLAATMHIDS